MKKLIILLLVLPFSLLGQDNIYSVTSPNGLNMRDQPGTNGNKIATLLMGDFVNLKQKTDKSLTINDFNKKITTHFSIILQTNVVNELYSFCFFAIFIIPSFFRNIYNDSF